MDGRWTAIALLLSTGCAADVASRAPSQSPPPAAAGELLVGRLKMRDRTIDLTASSFAPGRNDVPREAVATPVMADIDPDHRSSFSVGRDSFDPPQR